MPLRNVITVGVLALASAASAAALAQAPAVELRFHPGERIYSYPLDTSRGYASLVVQNVWIANRGVAPVSLNGVDLELIARERVVDIRKLGREELGASAANGNALQATGLLAALAFQFGGERVTGPDVRLAKSTTLAPGESLLVGHQLMGYKGTRDTLRVRVTGEVGGRPVETSATLPDGLRKLQGAGGRRFLAVAGPLSVLLQGRHSADRSSGGAEGLVRRVDRRAKGGCKGL